MVGKLCKNKKGGYGIIFKEIEPCSPKEDRFDYDFGYVWIYWFFYKSVFKHDKYYIKVGDIKIL